MAGLCHCFSSWFKANIANLSTDCQQFLVLGPENSGKTTLLYRLRLGQRWTTMRKDLQMMHDEGSPMYDPGFHYEEFAMLGNIGLWDIPGEPAMRAIWGTFFKALTIHGLFFVVDASDAAVLEARASEDPKRTSRERQKHEKKEREARERISQSRNLLHDLMNEDELRKCVVAVIINDRAGAVAATTNISKEDKGDKHAMHYRLGLHELHASCAWRVKDFVIDCDMLDGEKDAKWSPVLAHVVQALRHERSFSLELG